MKYTMNNNLYVKSQLIKYSGVVIDPVTFVSSSDVLDSDLIGIFLWKDQGLVSFRSDDNGENVSSSNTDIIRGVDNVLG